MILAIWIYLSSYGKLARVHVSPMDSNQYDTMTLNAIVVINVGDQ